MTLINPPPLALTHKSAAKVALAVCRVVKEGVGSLNSYPSHLPIEPPGPWHWRVGAWRGCVCMCMWIAAVGWHREGLRGLGILRGLNSHLPPPPFSPPSWRTAPQQLSSAHLISLALSLWVRPRLHISQRCNWIKWSFWRAAVAAAVCGMSKGPPL